MLTLSTFRYITRQEDKLSKPICVYLQQRFKQLHKTYCSNGSEPLERFCLHDYGEILIAEQFSEINLSAYECIEKIELDSTVIYRSTWVRNHDTRPAREGAISVFNNPKYIAAQLSPELQLYLWQMIDDLNRCHMTLDYLQVYQLEAITIGRQSLQHHQALQKSADRIHSVLEEIYQDLKANIGVLRYIPSNDRNKLIVCY